MDKAVAKSSYRNELLDIIKGVTIVLVVCGHCIQKGSGSEYSQNHVFFDNVIFKIIYSFHMPLFMLVSGYLFHLSVRKHSFNKVLLSRFTTLIIPIFVWAFLTYAIEANINKPDVTILGFLKTYLLIGINNLWFLWAIFYCSIVVLFVRKLFNDNIFVYILGFVLTFYISDGLVLANYKFMYPFFVLAYFYGKNEDYINILISKQKNSLKLLVLGFVFATMMIFYNHDSYIYTSGYYVLNKNVIEQFCIDIYRLLIGLVGSMFVILLLKTIINKLNNAYFLFLSKIGAFSLGIYIVSGYVFSWILPKLTSHFTSINYLIVIFETIVITAASYFVTLMLKKYKITRIIFLGGR